MLNEIQRLPGPFRFLDVVTIKHKGLTIKDEQPKGKRRCKGSAVQLLVQAETIGCPVDP